VTTNFLSASNLILHEEDGLIVDISEEGLYAGVKKLLEDEKLRMKFSRSLLVEDQKENSIKELFE